MVNCKKCGAPLSLNEAFCPYCGEANPEAQEHLKKLRELDEQFEIASQEVTAEVKKSRAGYGILITLVMLLFANLMIFAMHQVSYNIANQIIAGRMTEREIKAQLDQFLDGILQKETDQLAGAWKDNHYQLLRARVEPILAECSNALAVVTGTLTPFIERKRRWAEGRPNG